MTIDERTRLTLRITEDMSNKLKEEASQKGISVNALIVQILWEWLELKQSK